MHGLSVRQDYFRRRKADAGCVVAEKFKDPVGREENCICTDEDYEWYVNICLSGFELNLVAITTTFAMEKNEC